VRPVLAETLSLQRIVSTGVERMAAQ